MRRRRALDETAEYLDELADEVGEPNRRQQARAELVARRIREPHLGRAG